MVERRARTVTLGDIAVSSRADRAAEGDSAPTQAEKGEQERREEDLDADDEQRGRDHGELLLARAFRTRA